MPSSFQLGPGVSRRDLLGSMMGGVGLSSAAAARERQERLDAQRPLTIATRRLDRHPQPADADGVRRAARAAAGRAISPAGSVSGTAWITPSPTRFKGFEQAVLVRITTDRGARRLG